MSATGRGLPRLHVVTDDEVLARPDFAEGARRVLAAGAGVALHVRGPGTAGRTLWELGRALRPYAEDSGAALLVNDRVDVALLVGAHGVHLGERSLPARAVRSLLPGGAWVGVSVHDREAAVDAAAQEADYLMVGTIFATPSHPGRRGAGPNLLARVAADVTLPLLAIGGVTPRRVRPCLEAGAHGVAVLRGVWEAPDTERAVAGYVDAMGVLPVAAPGFRGEEES